MIAIIGNAKAKYQIETAGFGSKLTGTGRKTRFSSLTLAKKAAQTAANVKGGMVGVYDAATGQQIAIFHDSM